MKCGVPDVKDDVQFIEEEIIEETVVQSAEGRTTDQLELEQRKKEQAQLRTERKAGKGVSRAG